MGDYTNKDVPKKAIQAMDVIYQASTLLGVMEKAGIHEIKVKDIDVKWDVKKGTTGEFNVPVDAEVDGKKLQYRTIKTSLKWSKYPFLISDGSKLTSRDVDTLWNDAIKSASEYFATVKDYLGLSTLKAGAGGSAAATATWDNASADIEGDVVNAISSIFANSNVQDGEFINVVVPAEVYGELLKLNLINNVQQSLKDYLERSFKIRFLAYRPHIDSDGNQVLDALGNDALVFVEGEKTARRLVFDPAEAARRGIPLIERERKIGRGDFYTSRMAASALVMWDGIQTFSETAPKTARIFKITGVKA